MTDDNTKETKQFTQSTKKPPIYIPFTRINDLRAAVENNNLVELEAILQEHESNVSNHFYSALLSAALDTAITHSKIDIIEILGRKGVGFSEINIEGEYPLTRAVKLNKPASVIKLLEIETLNPSILTQAFLASLSLCDVRHILLDHFYKQKIDCVVIEIFFKALVDFDYSLTRSLVECKALHHHKDKLVYAFNCAVDSSDFKLMNILYDVVIGHDILINLDTHFLTFITPDMSTEAEAFIELLLAKCNLLKGQTINDALTKAASLNLDDIIQMILTKKGQLITTNTFSNAIIVAFKDNNEKILSNILLAVPQLKNLQHTLELLFEDAVKSDNLALTDRLLDSILNCNLIVDFNDYLLMLIKNSCHEQCNFVLSSIDIAAKLNKKTIANLLLYASEKGFTDIIKKILEAKSSSRFEIERMISKGTLRSMLSKAVHLRQTEIIKLILPVLEMHEPSQDTNTAIFCFLVSKKDKDGIKYALGIGLDIYKGTSLSDYIYFNDQESVKLLAKSGVNINKKDHKNITPLHLAVMENLNSMVNLLCQLGAHLYVENENGLNPIAVAALHEKRELVSILKMQADRVNLSWLDTIIQCARCKNENPLKLLKNEEVNIDEEDYDGETALF